MTPTTATEAPTPPSPELPPTKPTGPPPTPLQLLTTRGKTASVTVWVYLAQDAPAPSVTSLTRVIGDKRAKAELTEVEVQTTWTIPNVMQLTRYRRRAQRYYRTANAVLMDKLRFREILTENHLQSITLTARDPKGNQLGEPQVIAQEKAGGFSPENQDTLETIHSTVMEASVINYERAADLA